MARHAKGRYGSLRTVLGLLVVTGGVLAGACTPPGAKLDERALAQAGPEAKQEWEVPGGAERCDVAPPDVGFEDAKFGFVQTENNNPWRIAQTASMRSAARARGAELVVTDAQSSTPKQVSDIQDLVAQGVDVLFVPPREEEGLAPALKVANEADVPIFLVDREANAQICEDFVAFMGSDFVRQGERAADWLARETNEEAKIVELQGTVGASVTADRGKGFARGLKKYPEMEVIASQSGNFSRAEGQNVMEQLLGAYPDLTAVYTHNDEMAIGAIQALEDAGYAPGKDVTVVSVDGTRDALEAIVDGELGATVETNPRFGPLAFETAERFLSGERVPQRIIVQDRLFDGGNAEKFVDSAY